MRTETFLQVFGKVAIEERKPMSGPQQTTGWKDGIGNFHLTYEAARKSDLERELRAILVRPNSSYSYDLHTLIANKDAVVRILLQM